MRRVSAEDPIDVQGPRKEEFVRLARQDGTDPRPLLEVRNVFDSLGESPVFVKDMEQAERALEAGPREAIEAYLSGRVPG